MYVRLAQPELTRVKHHAEQGFCLHFYIHISCSDWQSSVLPLPLLHSWLNWPHHAADPSLQLVLRLIVYGVRTDIVHIKRYWTVKSINSICSADQWELQFNGVILPKHLKSQRQRIQCRGQNSDLPHPNKLLLLLFKHYITYCWCKGLLFLYVIMYICNLCGKRSNTAHTGSQ